MAKTTAQIAKEAIESVDLSTLLSGKLHEIKQDLSTDPNTSWAEVTLNGQPVRQKFKKVLVADPQLKSKLGFKTYVHVPDTSVPAQTISNVTEV